MNKYVMKVLPMVLLSIPSTITWASVSGGSDQLQVKESETAGQVQLEPKRQFLAYLDKIIDLATNDGQKIQQPASSSGGGRRVGCGIFPGIIRTDLLEIRVVNLVCAIAPLVEIDMNLKWQIDEECTQKLREMLLAVILGKNINRDRLYRRWKWVLQSLAGFNLKIQYFTPEAQELWKRYSEELEGMCQRQFPECLQGLTQQFRSPDVVLTLNEEKCLRLGSLVGEVTTKVKEMRALKIENAVTGDEMRDFMDALSWVWTGVGSAHSEEQQKQQRDLLCSTGFRDKVLEFMDAVHYIDEYDMDQDASGRFMLKDFRSGKVVEVNPGEFSQEELADLKDQTGQFCKAEGGVLTEDLYWWCTKGTGGTHQVFMSPWVQQMKEEMICWGE